MNRELENDDAWEHYLGLTPKRLVQWLREKGGIVGQDEAIKAAALILFNHANKRRSVNLFIGNSGCGKSHIWNVLQNEIGSEKIWIVDSNMITIEGYSGSTKISSIFKSLPSEHRERIILVLDEFDKLLEPQRGSHGTDYSALLQNQLLRLFNGDTMTFAGEDSFSVDTSKISIVLLGSFQNIRDKQNHNNDSTSIIGFGRQTHRKCTDDSTKITIEDLIRFGMRREIAGRINRIVHLNPLSVEDLTRIGQQEIRNLEKQLCRSISVDSNVLFDLACKAKKKGLGARWLKSQLNNAIDDLLYENPNAESFIIDFHTLYDKEYSQVETFME